MSPRAGVNIDEVFNWVCRIDLAVARSKPLADCGGCNLLLTRNSNVERHVRHACIARFGGELGTNGLQSSRSFPRAILSLLCTSFLSHVAGTTQGLKTSSGHPEVLPSSLGQHIEGIPFGRGWFKLSQGGHRPAHEMGGRRGGSPKQSLTAMWVGFDIWNPDVKNKKGARLA